MDFAKNILLVGLGLHASGQAMFPPKMFRRLTVQEVAISCVDQSCSKTIQITGKIAVHNVVNLNLFLNLKIYDFGGPLIFEHDLVSTQSVPLCYKHVLVACLFVPHFLSTI